MANLVLFLVLLETTRGPANVWAGRVCYIWVAIFNLFVVSVFWGFLADVFSSEQSRRLFGFIAAGGTAGGIGGSTLTSALVEHLGRSRLLLVRPCCSRWRYSASGAWRRSRGACASSMTSVESDSAVAVRDMARE